MKSIVRIVHLPSVVQSEFNEVTTDGRWTTPPDAFHTFMDLDSAIYYAVNGTVTSLPVFIQNILNCVPKTNEAFTGLERHGGK